MIIETTCNKLYDVSNHGDEMLSHCWYGIEVKRTKDGFKPKAKSRMTLVRKEATRIVEA